MRMKNATIRMMQKDEGVFAHGEGIEQEQIVETFLVEQD